MDIFHMWDVTALLGLPTAPSGKSSYDIKCPCCDTKANAKHLNINLRKEVFRCPRCDVSGGIFDLYALYTGMPRDKVRKALVEQIGMPEHIKRPKKEIENAEGLEAELAPIDVRHATYSAFLSKLELRPDHFKNLKDRGLLEHEIWSKEYRTTPKETDTIIRQLLEEGHMLRGVPGFFRDESCGWKLVPMQRGILIPVRDMDGRIQGMQIRRDNVKKRKFRWLSSKDILDGCHAEGWTHLAGEVSKRIILTEGPMKADVIHCLTKDTVLAVPGVNALTQLEKALLGLKERGVTEIKTAFDMDMGINPHVQSGYMKLLKLINDMGFQFSTYLWDTRYKGLDDFIWQYLMKQSRKSDGL